MKAPHRDVVPLFQTKWGAWLSQPARTSWTKPNLRDSSFYSYLSFSTLPSHYVSQSFIYCHIRSRQQIASGSFFKSSASKPRHYFVLHTHLLCRIQFIFYVASNSSSMSHPIHLLCRIQFIFYVASNSSSMSHSFPMSHLSVYISFSIASSRPCLASAYWSSRGSQFTHHSSMWPDGSLPNLEFHEISMKGPRRSV
jgi:hypothetical protein